MAAGTATITVTSVSSPDVSATCEVTVLPPADGTSMDSAIELDGKRSESPTTCTGGQLVDLPMNTDRYFTFTQGGKCVGSIQKNVDNSAVTHSATERYTGKVHIDAMQLAISLRDDKLTG